jgi:hypothetical protein
MFIVDHPPRLAQQRERLGRQLEPDYMRPRLRIRRIIGPVARAMIGDRCSAPQLTTAPISICVVSTASRSMTLLLHDVAPASST